MRIPPTIEVDLNETVRGFWQRRLDTHTHDFYRGLTLAKMPEDLRTYQHVIEDCQPDVIVEIGTYEGGSAVWFADQLAVLSPRDWRAHHPSVFTLDIDYGRVKTDDPRVMKLKGDIKDPGTWAQIYGLVAGMRVMISEDGHHSYDTTYAALSGLAHLVTSGSWFVVEDGIVDHAVKLPRYSGGVGPAIDAFLKTEEGQRFSRHDLRPYGLTTDIGGWLRANR